MFMCRLAMGLGKTLEEIEEIPVSELATWVQYWQEEPWGSYRDNLHAGLIASTVVNLARQLFGKKGVRPVPITASDYLLVQKTISRAKTTGSVLSKLRAIAKPRDRK